jgi:hypothetical protein
MSYRPSTLQRAFELARSGRVSSIETIRSTLKREGYDDTNLAFPHLIRQLRVLMFVAHRGWWGNRSVPRRLSGQKAAWITPSALTPPSRLPSASGIFARKASRIARGLFVEIFYLWRRWAAPLAR